MKDSPCKDCQERFTACSDKCPKDLRGEYGHHAWVTEYRKDEAEKQAWRRQKSEDMKRDSRYGFRAKNWRY